LTHGNAEGDMNSVEGVGCSVINSANNEFAITLASGIYRWIDDVMFDERGEPFTVNEGPKSVAMQ
jgi:hypothetical protein